MNNPVGTPAWGTPAPSSSATETQVLPQVNSALPRPSGPTRAEVELRSTALYYATRILGEQATLSEDSKTVVTLHVAKQLEGYLLTGDIRRN